MSSFVNISLEEFKSKFALVHAQVVSWGDIDMFQHVNNVMYYRYIENARALYISRLSTNQKDIATVIVTNSCHYIHSVQYPDTVYVGVRVTKVGTTSMHMSYTLYSQAQGRIVATGESVSVFMADDMSCKIPIAKEIKARMLSLEKRVGNSILTK